MQGGLKFVVASVHFFRVCSRRAIARLGVGDTPYNHSSPGSKITSNSAPRIKRRSTRW